MGSFNVSCGISGLSINCGDDVMLFILYPVHRGKIEPSRFLFNRDDFFKPLGLPIEGRYDEYGSLEDIVENEVTKGYERLFGLSIDEIVNNIANECSLREELEKLDCCNLQDLSCMFVLKDVYNALIEYQLAQENKVSDSYVSKQMLEKWGFVKVSEEEQPVKRIHQEELWRLPNTDFDIFYGEYGSSIVHKKHKDYFHYGDHRWTKEIVKDWAETTKTNFLEVFPQFADRFELIESGVVYTRKTERIGKLLESLGLKGKQFKLIGPCFSSAELEEVSKKFLELTGSHLFGNPKAKEELKSCYSVKSFAKEFEELTGIALDFSEYENDYKTDEIFNTYLDREKFFEKLGGQERIIDLFENRDQEALDQLNLTEQEQNFLWSYRLNRYRNVDELSNCFGNPKAFSFMLKENVIQAENELRKLVREYLFFYKSMYSCNKIFFPTLNGEQFENIEAEKVLTDVMTKIVEDRLEENNETYFC